MKPDFENAATKAYETIVKYGISSTPVAPLNILEKIKNVFVVSFTEMSDSIGIDRKTLLSTIGAQCQDAVTSVYVRNGQMKYIVAYNQRLPYYMLQRALARELGHIILGHDGSKPEEVMTAEVNCFGQHLLCPRPMIKAIEESGTVVTVEMLGTLTGCYGRCLAAMRKMPSVRTPAELNRKVKAQFTDYINNFLDYHSIIEYEDESPVADFGLFMNGYEE